MPICLRKESKEERSLEFRVRKEPRRAYTSVTSQYEQRQEESYTAILEGVGEEGSQAFLVCNMKM